MRYFLVVAIAILSTAAPVMAENAIGFRQLELSDDSGTRMLNLSLWYPSAPSGKTETVGENAAFMVSRFNLMRRFWPVPVLWCCCHTDLAEAGAI